MNAEETPIFSEKPNKSMFKEVAREVFIFALIAFGIVLPFRMYVVEPYLVDGRSMDPTFATGQYLIVNKISYEIRKSVSRESVVVFHYPNDTEKSFIKRIIGLPGETVSLQNGKVTITNKQNPEGFELDDSYVVYDGGIENMKVTLAEDEYFVMGDNRAESFDSRSWGPLKEKFILGEPVLRLFPFTKIDIMPGNKK